MLVDQLYQRTVGTLTLRKTSFCSLCLISCTREQWECLPWGRPLSVHCACWSDVPENSGNAYPEEGLFLFIVLVDQLYQRTVGMLTLRKASFCSLCLLISCTREQWKCLPWGRPLSVHYACWSEKASVCSLCLLISCTREQWCAYPEEGLFLFIMLVDQRRPLSVHFICWSAVPGNSGSAYPEEGVFLFILFVDQRRPFSVPYAC